MSYSVFTIAHFDKQLKNLIKKYPSVKDELIIVINNLKNEPKMGLSLGNSCYKIRLAISSKGKGKSGGARIITYLTISEEKIYLLSIYDKSQQDNISDKQLLQLIKIVK